ncbi:Protein kinase C signaling pathway involved MAPKK protein [Basidiobolus ranarum]|uniref:Protein kinase C signaling pathway involved MAPKK protein n=1 Tax=Basidiobolus ranarum TaxID=34480 RepID=A0ABR2WIV9_9FUNG
MASLNRSNATMFRKKNRNLTGLKISPISVSTTEQRSPSASLFATNTVALKSAVDMSNLHSNGENSDSTNEFLDLNPSNITEIKKLGEGAGGSVFQVRHEPTGMIMARKTVPADPDPNMQRQIIRELSFLRTCKSPYIVSFYGAYLDEEDTSISICMEYCHGGSFDAICRKAAEKGGRIGEGVLGKIAVAVLNGLVYLHSRHIIHRDVKPSNILLTSDGNIKLCDFGVSGELIDSIAATFVGTSYYMAPERIQGARYAVQSDIWSLGLTIIEIANSRFPFPPPGHPPLAIFELLDYIVRSPVPELRVEDGWSPEISNFITKCLIKDSSQRPTPRQLLNDPFVARYAETSVDLARFVREVWA